MKPFKPKKSDPEQVQIPQGWLWCKEISGRRHPISCHLRQERGGSKQCKKCEHLVKEITK